MTESNPTPVDAMVDPITVSDSVSHAIEPPRISIFQRLPWLLGLEAVLLVVLIYPLRLQDKWLGRWISDWKRDAHDSVWAWFGLDQLESWISFYHSPLVMKGIYGAVCLIAAMTLAVAYRVLRPLMPAAAPAEVAHPAEPAEPSPWISRYFVCWLAFIAWCAASAFWSSTPMLSLESLAWVVGIGAFGFFLLQRGISADQARQLAVLMMLLGTAVAFISLLEATEFHNGVIYKFFFKFDDARNAYGSLMGHNTAVGALMMMTCFPALCFAIDSRRVLGRVLASAYLALALITALVVQSRAIWILGPILGTIFIYVAARQHGRRLPLRFALYVFLVLGLGIGTQLIERPWNPLFVKGNTFRKRLADFGPELRGTRVRMLAASGSPIAEKPLIGHGLYAFQYVIPKAQGDYFARYPDSNLSRTTKRSNLAHNEYLQVLVEQGIIGLGLMMLALGEIWLRGRRISARLATDQQLLHSAFGFAALGVALQALVDFPFHVPQLVVPWIFCVAAYAAWREKESDEEVLLPGEAGGADGSHATLRLEPLPATTLRTEPVVRLVAAFMCILALPILIYPFAKAYQADIDYNYGQAYLESVKVNPASNAEARAQQTYLHLASQNLERAVTLQPAHDTARYLLGEIYFRMGVYMIQQERRQAQGGLTLFGPAIQMLEKARATILQSMESLRYHTTFYTLAGIDQALASVLPPERAEPYRKSYVENLELALQYAPSFGEAAYLMDQVLENRANNPATTDPAPMKSRQLALRRSIKQYNPYLFFFYYRRRFNELMITRDYESAMQAARLLLEVDPDDPLDITSQIESNMWGGNPDVVLKALKKLKNLKVDPAEYPVHPYWLSGGGLYETLILKDWPGVLQELDHHGIDPPSSRASLLAMETYARQKLGIEGMTSRYVKPEGMTDEEWEIMVADQKAITLYRLIRDIEAAKQAFQERIAMPGPAPSVDVWIEYAYLARELREEALSNMCAQKVREMNPRHPVLGRLSSFALPTQN